MNFFLHIHYFFVFHSFMSNLIFLQFLNFHLEMTFSQIDLPYLTLVIFKLSQHCLQSCECCSMRFPKSKSTSWFNKTFPSFLVSSRNIKHLEHDATFQIEGVEFTTDYFLNCFIDSSISTNTYFSIGKVFNLFLSVLKKLLIYINLSLWQICF